MKIIIQSTNLASIFPELIDIENLYKFNSDNRRCDDIQCQYLHAFYWSTLVSSRPIAHISPNTFQEPILMIEMSPGNHNDRRFAPTKHKRRILLCHRGASFRHFPFRLNHGPRGQHSDQRKRRKTRIPRQVISLVKLESSLKLSSLFLSLLIPLAITHQMVSSMMFSNDKPKANDPTEPGSLLIGTMRDSLGPLF